MESACLNTIAFVLTSPLLQVPHGFTTREGGVSPAPYASLNLGYSTQDDPANVDENRRRVLEQFGNWPLAELSQVHGNMVHRVDRAGTWEGDGLLTDVPGLLLRVGIADCYPILLHDPVRGVVGALHAGWRGTLAGILPKALGLMQQHYASQPANIRVAVGPGISGAKFQVGPEVIEQFKAAGLIGEDDPPLPLHPAPFPQPPVFQPDPAQEGKYLLDIEAVIRQQALAAGVLPEHYWAIGLCTYADPRFFSHRRDRGLTGRMWALIGLPEPG